MMKLYPKLAALSLLYCSTSVNAAIDVNPSIVILEEKATQEAVVIVSNSNDKIAYVTTEPREVMARGEADEKLRVDADPTSLGILSSPSKLVLEKGERRSVRIVAVSPPGKDDRVWRVKIAPAAGKIKAGQSGVAFVIGYDILVIQRAANPTVKVSIVRAGKKLTLSNTGNSFGMISEIRQCQDGGDCVKLKDTKRLYGNMSWTVELPQDGGRIEVDVDGVENKRETIKFPS